MHGFFVILPVVLVMAAGWMLGKRRVVLPEAFAQINKAIYWVAIPALILRMTSSADMSTLADKNMVLAVYASFLLAPPFAWYAARMAGEKRENKATSTLMLIRSNTVFMGLPVDNIAVGMKGVEVLSLYLAFTFIGYQIISISWAQLALSGGISRSTVKETLKNLAEEPACRLSTRRVCTLGFRVEHISVVAGRDVEAARQHKAAWRCSALSASLQARRAFREYCPTSGATQR